jgi:U3 small nucleolar RNA-associated protein 24
MLAVSRLSPIVSWQVGVQPFLLLTVTTTGPSFTVCGLMYGPELEKLPQPKYRIALQIARDERWDRLRCDGHKGTYADDCLVNRVMKHKIYIVATNDRDLKRRLRRLPGIPIMSVARGKYVIERLPDAPEK